jgi:hypothetical protein
MSNVAHTAIAVLLLKFDVICKNIKRSIRLLFK